MSLDSKRRERAMKEANRRLESMGGVIDLYAKCPEPKRPENGGGQCDNRAGHLTDHIGAGKCGPHGGNGTFEKLVCQLMLMHGSARELDAAPWDVLLMAMRRAAGTAAFYDHKLAAVIDDNELKPGGEAYAWVIGSETQWKYAARYAKMALDAGVAERLVQGIQVEAGLLYTFFTGLMEELRLSPELEEKARLFLRNKALALDAAGQWREEEGDIIEGDVVGGEESTRA